MELTTENHDINNVDRDSSYNIQHNTEDDYYLVKCEYKLVFIDNQYSTYVKSNLIDNKTMVSSENFFKKAINDFKNKEYNFNHIEELNFIKNN